MSLSKENLAYEETFIALEMLAGAAHIRMGNLHHRYRSATPAAALRNLAAQHLRAGRDHDKATVAKVWKRHRKQIVSN